MERSITATVSFPLVKNPQHGLFQGEIWKRGDINRSTTTPCLANVEYLRRHTLLGGVSEGRVMRWLVNMSRSRKS